MLVPAAALEPFEAARRASARSAAGRARRAQQAHGAMRANQEQATNCSLQEGRQRAVERMIKDGLRVPDAEPRDRARLLLYRVETCPATAL